MKSMIPTPAREFRWSDETWGLALRCAPLEAAAQHLFTTRQLQLRPASPSGPADDRTTREPTTDAVESAWAMAAASVGAGPDDLRRVKQVHGRRVRVIDSDSAGAEMARERPEADAIVSDQAGLVLVVQVADCVPVLMADRRRGAAAAAHAGWRGTCAGVSRATVEAMAQEFGTDPTDLVVAIGPSIGACCYTVGAELFDAFRSAGASEAELARWFSRTSEGDLRLDLWSANRDQLLAVGVRDEHIHTAALCTQTHAHIFDSYRVAGPRAGRMAALIMVPRRG